MLRGSQNARQVTPDEDRFMFSSARKGPVKVLRLIGSSVFLLVAFALSTLPSLAHHPFGMMEGAELTPLQGLISGIGHPLLGPDHLLFLLAIGFVGLSHPRRWLLPLLACGLLGSLISQVIHLPVGLDLYAEAVVAITLAFEGLVALGAAPPVLLLPVIGLHGYLLGGTIVGAEPTPLLAYFLGLLLGQGALLLVITTSSRRLLDRIGPAGQRLAAGIWIGLGSAFAWSILVP